MALQDLSFTSAARPRDWVTLDTAYTFTLKAYSGGSQVTPSSATISIVKPGGAALPSAVTDAAMTISGSDMTYQLSAANAAELGANYTATVKYVVSGTTYRGRFLFDVVRHELVNPVQPSDLTRYHYDLTDLLMSGESNAQTYIVEAFIDVCEWLDSLGNRPYLALDSAVFRRAIEHKALERFFMARQKSADDRWATFADKHRGEYEREKASLGPRLVYDFDQSGTADGTSAEAKSGEEGALHTGLRYRV